MTCKCGAAYHAACVKRSSQDVHKSFTCEQCAHKAPSKRSLAAGAGGGGGQKKKTAKARLAAVQEQQNLLSIV